VSDHDPKLCGVGDVDGVRPDPVADNHANVLRFLKEVTVDRPKVGIEDSASVFDLVFQPGRIPSFADDRTRVDLTEDFLFPVEILKHMVRHYYFESRHFTASSLPRVSTSKGVSSPCRTPRGGNRK